MFSRKFIIVALIILGIMYFGFNFYSQPADGHVITENKGVIEASGTVGRS